MNDKIESMIGILEVMQSDIATLMLNATDSQKHMLTVATNGLQDALDEFESIICR